MSKANFDKHSLAPDPNVALPASHAGTEAIGLDTLLNLMNDPLRGPVEGSPLGEAPTNVLSATTPKTLGTPVAASVPTPVLQRPTPRVSQSFTKPAGPAPTRIFFTGQLGSGKDHAANEIGAAVFSFAEPMYALASYLFGVTVSATVGKDIPGVRESLQRLGQIGRGTVSPQYPWTPERAMVVDLIRRVGPEVDQTVDWTGYGHNDSIWLDALLRRIDTTQAPLSAVTNVRFANEFKRLTEAGFTHYHIMCSPATLALRQGPSITSAAKNDVSESLALKLDADVTARLKQPGKRLRVIWSDTVAPPSERLLTVEAFKAIFRA